LFKYYPRLLLELLLVITLIWAIIGHLLDLYFTKTRFTLEDQVNDSRYEEGEEGLVGEGGG